MLVPMVQELAARLIESLGEDEVAALDALPVRVIENLDPP